MNNTEWKRLIQEWTGMSEEKWKVRQKILKVLEAVNNWKKEEIDLMISIIRPFSVLGFQTIISETVGEPFELSTLDINKIDLENTLLQQNLDKEKYLSTNLVTLLKTKQGEDSFLRQYGQAKIAEACIQELTKLTDRKSFYHDWVTKIQFKQEISGLCPNISNILDDTFVQPFLLPEWDDLPDKCCLSLIPSDLNILAEWKWKVADKFLSLGHKYSANYYLNDSSIDCFSLRDALQKITPAEILNQVANYDKAYLTNVFDEKTTPYFVLCLSKGLDVDMDSSLEIYALLYNKTPRYLPKYL